MSDEWVETQLTDCVEVLDKFRCPVSAAERASREGNVPYYGATGRAGWIDESLFDEPLVLLGEDAVDFGNPAASKAYFVDGPSWVNNHAHVLRCDLNLVAPKVLVEALNLMDYSPYVSFGTRSKLTQASMRTMRLTLPPLSVQARIVDLLEHLDTLIANLEQERDALTYLEPAFMSELYPHDVSAPTGAVLSEIAAVVDCEHKTAPASAAMPPYGYSIGTGALKDGGIDFMRAKPVDEATWKAWSRRAQLQSGDLILAREAPVGAVARVDGAIPVCLGQRTVLIRANPDEIDATWLWGKLRSPAVQQTMTDQSSGLTVHHLNVKDIRGAELGVLPSKGEQDRVGRDLLKIHESRAALIAETEALKDVRLSVLSSLLSREIEIPETYDELLGVAS